MRHLIRGLGELRIMAHLATYTMLLAAQHTPCNADYATTRWRWCAEYSIKGFGEQWGDGKALNGLVDAVQRLTGPQPLASALMRDRASSHHEITEAA